MNFLGWPLSALGALVLFIPMGFVAYFMLYQVKTKLSFYVTVVIFVLVLFMGALNFNAAVYNFWQVRPLGTSVDSAVIAVWIAVLAIFIGLNCIIVKKR